MKKAQVMMNKPAQQKERQIQHVKIKTRSITTFTVRYKTVTTANAVKLRTAISCAEIC